MRSTAETTSCYRAGLAGIDGIRLLPYDPADGPNYHYVVLEVDPALRDDLVAVLQAENVRARRYFHPCCHRHEPYAAAGLELPVSEAVSARVVTLPTGEAMAPDDIALVCSLIRLAAGCAPELRRRLSR